MSNHNLRTYFIYHIANHLKLQPESVTDYAKKYGAISKRQYLKFTACVQISIGEMILGFDIK